MLPQAKSYLKIYSIIVVGAIGIKMFLSKKPNELIVAALIPTFIYLCNV